MQIQRWLLWCPVVLCLHCPLQAADIPRHSQPKQLVHVVQKINLQSIGQHCSARREWIEIEGLSNHMAQRRINKSIRHQITVGKTLKAEDCYGEDGDESYVNTVVVTGLRPDAVGVEIKTHFGGSQATGTHLSSCAVFDLTTGHRFDLAQYLTQVGKGLVAESICRKLSDGSQGSIGRYCSGFDTIQSRLYYGTRYCLQNSSVSVRFSEGNLTEDEIIIPDNRVATSFRIPGNLNLQ